MPRKPRIISSTGIYHVILRSVNQHIIFEEESDYLKFLYILSDCRKKYETEIYAYCLMDNHIHILLNSAPHILSRFFQSLETKFVRWYNNKYKRSGHLFQDRFHSSVVDNNSAFLSVLFYIHNNPVKAKLCRFQSEYRWSSVNAYYGQKNLLVNTAFAYGITGSKKALHSFFSTHSTESDDTLYINDHKENRFFITDEKALAIFKSVTDLPSTSAVAYIIKTKRDEFVRVLKEKGLTTKQVARVMDISETTVKRLCRMAH